MRYIKGTTRAQTIFLRACAKHPYGPPADVWPSPVILRRWLKRPGFCDAMNSILRALRYQADFHLAAAAATGAHHLHQTLQVGEADTARKQIESLVQLLRMSHIRHRFAEPLPKPQPRGNDVIELLRMAHPSITVEEALRGYDVLNEDDDDNPRPPDHRLGYSTWKKTGHPFSEDWPQRPHATDGDGSNDDDEDDDRR